LAYNFSTIHDSIPESLKNKDLASADFRIKGGPEKLRFISGSVFRSLLLDAFYNFSLRTGKGGDEGAVYISLPVRREKYSFAAE